MEPIFGSSKFRFLMVVSLLFYIFSFHLASPYLSFMLFTDFHAYSFVAAISIYSHQ
jgi:hypothetical protein